MKYSINPFETPQARETALEMPTSGGARWVVLAYLLFSFAAPFTTTFLARNHEQADVVLFVNLQSFGPLLGLLVVLAAGVRPTVIGGLILHTIGLISLFAAESIPIPIVLGAIAAGAGLVSSSFYIWLARMAPADHPFRRAFLVALAAMAASMAGGLSGLTALLPQLAALSIAVLASGGAAGVAALAGPPEDRDEGFAPKDLMLLGVLLVASAVINTVYPSVYALRFDGDVGMWTSTIAISRGAIGIAAFIGWLLVRDRHGPVPAGAIAGTSFGVVALFFVAAVFLDGTFRWLASAVILDVQTVVWPVVVILIAGFGTSKRAAALFALYTFARALSAGSLVSGIDVQLLLAVSGGIIAVAAAACFAISTRRS